MNNLDQMLYLKMGNKLIFKEPLKGIKYAVEQYQNPKSNINRNDKYDIYKPNYNQKNNVNNMNNMNKVNKKRNYQNMDVIPKFIAYENSQEVNRDLANRLLDKKAKLNTLINAYISGEQSDFNKAIMDVELEMDKYKSIMEQQKSKDFEGYKELLTFINNNKTNSNLKALQSISLNDYRNMNYDMKKRVLSGIFENRETISKKLNVNVNSNSEMKRTNSLSYKKHENMNINNNYENNNYNNNNNNNNNNNINNYNINDYSNYNMMMHNQMPITQEQIDLFKIFVNNPNISNNHVESYFNKSNPKVIEAAEKYFKNIYKADFITLNYKYKNRAPKVHKFRFSGNLDALFLAAQEDYLSIIKPRLFLENGREIVKDKRIKCIGSLNLENNSTINVW